MATEGACTTHAAVLDGVGNLLDLEKLAACYDSCRDCYAYLNANECIWKKACQDFGLKQTKDTHPRDWDTWKEYALLIVKRLKEMRTSRCFTESSFRIYKMKHRTGLKGIYYYNDKFSLASANTIEMWRISSNTHLFDLSPPDGAEFNSLSVKFDDLHIMVADKSNRIRRFGVSSQQEEGAYGGKDYGMTSYDFESRCDIVVGRRVGGTILIWKLSTGELVGTLKLYFPITDDSNMNIVFIRSPSTNERGLLHLLCMNRHRLLMWRITFVDDIMSEGGIDCGKYGWRLDINPPEWYLQNRLLLARPVSHGSFAYYSHPYYDTRTGERSCNIREIDLKRMQISRIIETTDIIRDVLAVGEKYIAFQARGENGIEKLRVIEKTTSELVATYELPSDVNHRHRRERNTVTFCDGNWLDGLDLTNDKGIFLAYLRRNERVYSAGWIPRDEVPV